MYKNINLLDDEVAPIDRKIADGIDGLLQVNIVLNIFI